MLEMMGFDEDSYRDNLDADTCRQIEEAAREASEAEEEQLRAAAAQPSAQSPAQLSAQQQQREAQQARIQSSTESALRAALAGDDLGSALSALVDVLSAEAHSTAGLASAISEPAVAAAAAAAAAAPPGIGSDSSASTAEAATTGDAAPVAAASSAIVCGKCRKNISGPRYFPDGWGCDWPEHEGRKFGMTAADAGYGCDNCDTIGGCDWAVCQVCWDRVGAATAAAAPKTPSKFYRVIHREGANVREGLDLSSDVTTTLSYGAIIEVAEEQLNSEAILRVRLADGRGWTSTISAVDRTEKILEELDPITAAVALSAERLAAAQQKPHSGEWRDQQRFEYHCAIDAMSFQGCRHMCAHPGGIIPVSHWSCCGIDSASSTNCVPVTSAPRRYRSPFFHDMEYDPRLVNNIS